VRAKTREYAGAVQERQDRDRAGQPDAVAVRPGCDGVEKRYRATEIPNEILSLTRRVSPFSRRS
jgi:hypothetical protein